MWVPFLCWDEDAEVSTKLKILEKLWEASGAESTLHNYAQKEHFALILLYLHTLFYNIYNIYL